MTQTYLRRHYFDGSRLRERALLEFVRAHRTGRLVAFTGSMTTEDTGYIKWGDFARNYLDVFESKTVEKTVELIRNPPAGAPISEVVKISVLDEARAFSDAHDPKTQIDRDRERFAQKFTLLHREASLTSQILGAVIDNLGIRRIATLNYDLELEWRMMVTPSEKAHADSRQDVFARLLEQGAIRVGASGGARGSLTRIHSNGLSVLSDVFNRERTDRLIEFAVGSPEHDGHILHLHGRADDPEGMLISLRDYDRRYRRSGIGKLPFENAQRILFAGNPVLFLGLGMNEDEINRTLQAFISDRPYQRTAPTFLLWNTPTTGSGPAGMTPLDLEQIEAEKTIRRLDWLHRLGVHVIFDDELLGQEVSLEKRLTRIVGPRTTWVARSADKGKRLAGALKNLARYVADQERLHFTPIGDFRSIHDRMVKARQSDDPEDHKVHIWRPLGEGVETPPDAPASCFDDQSLMRVIIGTAGIGKGQLARQIRDRWHEGQPERRSLLINASFSFDLESVLDLLAEIVEPRRGDRTNSRSRWAIWKDQNWTAAEPWLVVFNGMERFFATSGRPQSAELDRLLRLLAGKLSTSTNAQPYPVRWRFLGTRRVQRYFEQILGVDASDPSQTTFLKLEPGDDVSVYLQRVREAFAVEPTALPAAVDSAMRRKSVGGIDQFRRAAFAFYLDPATLEGRVAHPDLCLEILKIMTFIGAPVESAVLPHAPSIKRMLRGIVAGMRQGRRRRDALDPDAQLFAHLVEGALDDLARRNLVIELHCFSEPKPLGFGRWRRFGLHRALLAELRDRFGVPLADAKVSTAANLSLFAAQPVDGYNPEADIHDDLGELVDWLIGGYKDPPIYGPAQGNPAYADIVGAGSGDAEHRRTWPHTAACLRAALAIMRTYYSTAALVTVEHGDRPEAEDRDGVLTEHGERIDRLLRAYGRIRVVRRRNAPPSRAGKRAAAYEAWTGPTPFYADDLVWLLNERGVLKLTQGDLYEARVSFEEAFAVNKAAVEFRDKGHNWRQISLNQLAVDIERGRLDQARDRIRSLESHVRGFEVIVATYAREDRAPARTVDPLHEHNDVLTAGLLVGYRALFEHLRGNLRRAEEGLARAVRILGAIGEQRAYALFQRQYAALCGKLHSQERALTEIDLSIAAAETARQMDLAHQARILEVRQPAKNHSVKDRLIATQRLTSALRYALVTDMYRVQVEARVGLAKLKLDGGDFEAALEHAAEAMAVSARYGLSLRKITVRILLGQILIRRGDPKSGKALVDKAIQTADRINYQRAVERAQQVLVEEGA